MDVLFAGRFFSLKCLRRERVPRHLPGLRPVRHGPGGDELRQDVSDGRRFRRAGDDRDAAGIGRELVQQAVLRAAADNVQDVNLRAAQPFQVVNGLPVGVRPGCPGSSGSAAPTPSGAGWPDSAQAARIS